MRLHCATTCREKQTDNTGDRQDFFYGAGYLMSTFLDLGSVRIDWLCGGDFELDGGTMYGAVPKVLWQKRYPADEDNYIKIPNAPLLIRTGTHAVLVDTGLGNKLSAKQREIFRIYQDWRLPEDLDRLGLAREDIDLVILTHCDFDHAGGVVMHGDDGAPELTFPRARHIIQKREWEDVCQPNSRAKHTYWPENVAGLAESGLLELVDGDVEVAPGITVRLTGGHTRGHQLVEIRGRDGAAVHLGDVLPTHTHTNPLWIMAYDNFPLDVIAVKESLLPRYQEQSWWFTFYHDIHMKACRLNEKACVGEQLA
jgi:glyoxylase-like metal-dependent hydrolase (beta-lactamase superfamily II)